MTVTTMEVSAADVISIDEISINARKRYLHESGVDNALPYLHQAYVQVQITNALTCIEFESGRTAHVPRFTEDG